MKDFSNGTVRFGWAPSKEFQLTLMFAKWEGELSPDDSMGQDFAKDINADRPPNSQINFRNAILDQNDVEFRQIELGVTRSIEITPKHWEAYVGLGAGLQNSKANFTWVGPCTAANTPPGCYSPPTNDPDTVPVADVEVDDEFMISVRGGLRYSIVDWAGLHLNFRWIPIASMFDREYNGLELNLGVMFRFGKFKTAEP